MFSISFHVKTFQHEDNINMQKFRKQIMDIFSKRLAETYTEHCGRHHLIENNNTFLDYLIDNEFLNERKIRHFVILSEFNSLYEKNGFHKTNTVRQVADRFNLTDRTIWSVIKANAHKIKK